MIIEEIKIKRDKLTSCPAFDRQPIKILNPQLTQSAAVLIVAEITAGAPSVFCKTSLRLFLIAVDFPASRTLVMPAFLFHKRTDIVDGIAEKNADFVGKIFLLI
jgi:hypothetical protein